MMRQVFLVDISKSRAKGVCEVAELKVPKNNIVACTFPSQPSLGEVVSH